MSDYGFRKPGRPKSAKPKGLDLSGLPEAAPPIDPQRERAAIARGEALGFTDRGQGRAAGRRRPPAPPSASLYIKGPADIIDWFIRYTEAQGHSAYWKALEDFRRAVEQR